MRIQIATELKTKIEKKISSENQKAKKQGKKSLVVAYNKRMMDESDQLKLMRTAKKIISDKFIPKDLQLVEMGQTLLFMLQSRKRNINQTELDSIEMSGSLDNFQGFFSDNNAKQLFKITLEHFVFCIKKKACT